ncbi:MAG: DegT/DnrJ/EryC1/StrS family aminotransferase [Planctomycetota bacterium]|nr:DegT/DnrJ/EryC1/StrS family aminotransferase [Planctomycetota bacterium]MDE1888887.1 DegT/DnrJ/EryC1/StrS family aminotransferase [Planctomycetota bacterium]MDE2215717.1 DegT/DnrJ/EryC1/StrS family aminotransferase [Planctomycetota bacterium]
MTKKGNKPARENFLIFGSPRIEEAEINEVVDTLRSGWLSTGPKVAKFEEMFRKHIGTKYAMALNSCTAGLHLAMIVLGLDKGDEIITTPMTFAATANVITHIGARPVFVDIDKRTMNIDPNLIEKSITKKTKAIIPVHFAGRPCDMDAIMSIARKHHLLVITDAAHAIEAEYKGQRVGSIGDMTVFSFYVTKNVCTGEGGMVTTNNREWAEKVQMYGLHGMSKGAWHRYSDKGFKHYQVIFPGYKYNMMDIQAALGIHQLRRVNTYHKIREKIWKKYDKAFHELPVILPAPAEKNTVHARHLYTPLLDIDKIGISRDTFQQALHNENIGTGIHFVALHLHPYYANTFGFKRDDFPNAEFVSDRTISLPLSAKLTEADTDDVIRAVKKIIEKYYPKRNY